MISQSLSRAVVRYRRARQQKGLGTSVCDEEEKSLVCKWGQSLTKGFFKDRIASDDRLLERLLLLLMEEKEPLFIFKSKSDFWTKK